MANNEGYIIKDYTGDTLKITHVYSVEDLMGIIDKAHETNQQIAVYKLGECLVDWS